MRAYHCLLWFVLALSSAGSAHAEELEAAKDRARAEFVAGAELAQGMRWGEALARFERSAQLHAHAGTTYNIGVCLRALGQFTRAQRAFQRALAEHTESGDSPLPPHMLRDTQAFLEEISSLLARLDVELVPASARITLDGRPLTRTGSEGGRPVLTAGLAASGRGTSPPASRFVLISDPGSHVMLISRRGYADVVRRIDLAPGSRRRLELVLERLPGELAVSADRAGAVVSVDGLDVGVAPVSLTRPPGRHRVVVRKPDFVTYSTLATLRAGELVRLDAELEPKPVALTERWWFWAGIGAAVVGIGVGTYYLTRPDPERPAVSGGSLGWAVEVP
jgi:hypothetical protein